MLTVRDLRDHIRPAPPLAPEDSGARAARLLRARGLPALPVGYEGRLIGLVCEEDLLARAAEAEDPREALRKVPVSELMRPNELAAGEQEPLRELAAAVRQAGVPVVPVAAAGGRYVGVLLVRDLLAALAGEAVVPPIAGLSTPAGVYLTTGALRAGAGDWALAATGAALMLMNLAAGGVVYGLAKLADYLLPPAPEAAVVEPAGPVAVAVMAILYGLQIGIFLLLLRASPLSRIHGAEHMVVRAVEEGEDLEPEKVSHMPRVHPRCGTNLMALLILLVIAQEFLSSLSGAMDEATRLFVLVILVMIVLVTWRRLGSGLQRWITTRRPSERQLAGAIRTARELVERVRERPSARASVPRRIWNSGFPQVLAGFVALALAAEYVPPAAMSVWSWLAGS
jgi:CBS domain-containing protein